MKVIYFSFSGNVQRFIKRTELSDVMEITEDNCQEEVNEPYILVTGTIGFGEVPQEVQQFLQVNHQHLQAVAASGNRNWGQNFAKAGQTISEQYNVPLLMKFEVQGSNSDVKEFKDKVGQFNENYEREKYNHIELNNEVTKRKESGFFNLEKDQEALKVYLEEIHDKTIYFDDEIERLHYLVDHDFYFNVFDKYSEIDLREITDFAKSIEFNFASYMSASKFYKDYALKTNDKSQYLEDYNQHVTIVALYLANGNKAQAKQFISAMVEQRYQPATPTFLNAGRARRGELVSCFLLEVDDSLNSINFIDSTAKQLSKIGGGVAINLSKLRARGEAIKGIKGVAKGVLPVAKSLEGGFSYADQLGQRPGAGAVYLNIFHYDVEEFLDTKKVNADEDLRLSTISTGLIVPSKFFDLAKEGKDFYMFAPHTVKQEYGVTLDDIDLEQYYDDMVANPNIIKKKKDAREMLNTIAQTQLQSGYPYLMFKDNANKVHANSNIGQIKMSNLCTEIFQLQETSIINDYGIDDEIKRDISCNLGSLNIVNVMETGKFRDSVFTGMDALTVVSDEANIQNAPGVRKANSELHSVGLGVMNLHGYFAKIKLVMSLKRQKILRMSSL